MNKTEKAYAPNITVRLAKSEDAEPLTQLCRTSFSEAFAHLYDPSDFNAYMDSAYQPQLQLKEIRDESNRIFLVEVDGELAAYAKCGACKLPVLPKEPSFEIHRIYALKKFHRMGLGKMLMLKCMDEAAARGAKQVHLGVWQENAKAIAFYRALGFQEIACYHFHVGTQVDREFIMVRDTLSC